LALTWLSLGLGAWVGYQLLTQNGRLLLRVEALEQQLAQLSPSEAPLSPGLPVGTVLQDFDLQALAGGRMTLSQWQGKQVLLIFFDPRCPFCREMLPNLSALSATGQDGRPVPLILTTGDVEENRRLIAEHGIQCPVLLQEDSEVAALYQADGTPMGYLVDAHGVTISPLITGGQALLTVAGAGAATNGQGALTPARGARSGLVTRAPARSRINRSGLAAGTQAPSFRLPSINGGEISLEQYRGGRTLLVFSDPDCGPCNALAPELEKLHRQTPDLQVLMIGRGEPEANRARAVEHGLTFPVALQRRWEISQAYGMFATPIGYLIDEQGVIAADVAMGRDAILDLATHSSARTEAHGGMPVPHNSP
jgi:peroxiredoxin